MITYAKCGLVTLNLMVRRPSLPHPSSSLREKQRRMTRLRWRRCAWWQGNRLAGEGLSGMCTGLARNKSLTYLCLADNLINNVGGPVIRPLAFTQQGHLTEAPCHSMADRSLPT